MQAARKGMNEDLFGPLFDQQTVAQKQQVNPPPKVPIFTRLSELRAPSGIAIQDWHRELVSILLTELDTREPIVINMTALAERLKVGRHAVYEVIRNMASNGLLVEGPKAHQRKSYTLGEKAIKPNRKP